MPACLTHYTFVKENYNNSDKYYHEAVLGGQGPDVFFFYGHAFKKRVDKKVISGFGTYLHHVDISEIYLKMVQIAQSSEHKDVLMAYVKGMFMHYTLDRNLHPYIFYRSGLKDTEPDAFMLAHQYFESRFDYLYSKSHNTFIMPAKELKIPNSSVKAIGELYFKLSKEIGLDYIKEDSFENCYKDMMTVIKVLSSKTGFKKRCIFSLFFKGKAIDAMSLPRSDKAFKKYDLLNTSHSEWADCVTDAKRNESIEELVIVAKNELKIVDNLLLNPKLEEYKKFINNIDHDGFVVGSKKKYFKYYLENVK